MKVKGMHNFQGGGGDLLRKTENGNRIIFKKFVCEIDSKVKIDEKYVYLNI